MSSTTPAGPGATAGTWRQVAVVVDGKDVPVGRATLLTVTPTGYTVSVFGRVYQAGTSRADLGATPHQSDVTVTQGPNAGQTLHQIFQVEGDVLVACTARSGAPRPTAFTSAPGSGQTLSVWLRVPDRPPATLTPTAWWVILVLSLMLGGGLAEAPAKGVFGQLESAGAVAVRGLAGGVLVGGLALVLSRFTRADWPTRRTLGGYGLLFGVGLPVTLGVYDGLRRLLEPEHGWLGWGLSLLAATAVGLAVAVVLGWIVRRVSPGSLGE